MARETRKVHIDVSSNVGASMSKGTAAATGMAGAVGGVGVAAKKATFSLRSMTAALTSSGIGAIVVAVGSLIAGIGSLIGKSKEFEASLSNVQSISGETSEGMSVLKQNAKELGATTAFTASEVLELSTELAKLGFDSKQIKAASKGILDLAAATGSDLAEAATVAAGTLRGFGMDASETGRVADVMANSFSSSGLDINKFAESMKLVAPISNTLGESLEVTTGALSVLADNQIAGSMAGTQLRKIMSDLAMKTGKSFQESLKITAEKLSKATSNAEKLAIAKKLVGDRAKGSLLVLAKNRDIVGQLAAKYEQTGVASEKANLQLNNLEGDLTILGSAWEGFILSLEDGGGALNKIFRTVTQVTTGLLGFFTTTKKGSDATLDSIANIYSMETQLDSLNDIIEDSTTSEDNLRKAQADRKGIIDKLVELHPKHLGNIDSETVSNRELKKSIEDVTDALIDKMIVEQQDEEVIEQAKDTAEAKSKLAKAELAELKEIGKVKAIFKRDYGEKLQATTAQGLIDEITALQKLQKGTNKMYKSKFKLLVAVDAVRVAQSKYTKEQIKSNKALEEKNAILEQLNITLDKNDEAEGKVAAPKKRANLASATVETPEEKAKRNVQLEAKKAFLLKLKKLEQDTDDKTALEKIQRNRERHLADLATLKMTATERREAEKAINDIYDIKEADQKVKNLQAFNEKFGDGKMTALEKIQQNREEHLLALEDLTITETEKEELKLRIKQHYDKLTNEANSAQAKKDEEKNQKDIADAQKVAEEKRRALYSVLDSAADVAGRETAIGRGLLAMKLALQLKELAMKMGFIKQELVAKGQKAMAEANIEGGKIATATASGMAETSKVGFPWNVITMAGYALQAASLVKQFTGSKKKLAAITGVSGTGSSGGATAAPSTPPSFNVLGQTTAGENMIANTVASVNDNPMRAYVVADDVTTSQGIRRNTEAMASVG